MATRKRSGRKFAAYNVTRKTVHMVSQEQCEQLKELGIEAEPLLSEIELIKEMKELFQHLPMALEICQTQEPGQYGGFEQEHLHAMGHIVAIAMCLRYRQSMHEHAGQRSFLCHLLQEFGI
jgi:hypothetical protein